MLINWSSSVTKSLSYTKTILLVFIGLLFSGISFSAELVWIGDFETADFSQYKDKLSGEGERSSKKLVTNPVRSGQYAVELTTLGIGSDSVERAELQTILENGGGLIKFEWDGPEYWIGFSFLFTEWDANAHTFFQIHAPNQPKGDPCDYAGNAFSIWGDGEDSNNGIADTIAVRVIENGGTSSGKGAASGNKVIHSYPFALNQWQDYVVNFRLSTRGQGYYHIWKNGKQIYSKSGITNVNYIDSCGKLIPESKTHHNGVHIGVYAPGNPAFRRIYYDEVRVAQGSNGYNLVAPGTSDSASKGPVESAPNAPTITQGN